MERMKRLAHLEVHEVRLEAVGPLFVGDGRLLDRRQFAQTATALHLLSEEKFAEWLVKENLVAEWAAFLEQPAPAAIDFIKQYGGDVATLATVSLQLARQEEVMRVRPFVRHPDGSAYLPGSTLKGCIATALLVWALNEMPLRERQSLAAFVRRELQNGAFADRKLKEMVFHRLRFNSRQVSNPVNSLMRIYSFDDSAPLATEDFVLAARDDVGPEGASPQEEWREALRPGTIVSTKLTIDLGLMGRIGAMLTLLSEALEQWQLLQERVYHDAIPIPDRAPVDRREQYLYLGGGAGFVNKTIIYALFEREEAKALANEILAAKHSHYDLTKGKKTAPYLRHLSRLSDGDKAYFYDLGKCRIDINY